MSGRLTRLFSASLAFVVGFLALCLLFFSPNAQARPTEPQATPEPPVLGEHCVDVGPLPPPPEDWCGCVWGAVYANGVPTVGVTITLAHAGLETTFVTTDAYGWQEPYYALDGRAVGAVYGDWMTITVTYEGQVVSRTYRAFPSPETKEQQVNLAFPDGTGSPPTASIDEVSVVDDSLLLRGSGTDSDEGGVKVVGFEWLSDLDGVIGTEITTTLPLADLKERVHTLGLKVLDDEGMWSSLVTETFSLGESVIINGQTIGEIDVDAIFTATVYPLTITKPITFVWRATEQLPITYRTHSPSSTILFTWDTPGEKTILVTVTNATGITVADTHYITIAQGWITECVDCPPYFDSMANRRLVTDVAGRPHVVYGGDHLYHAWHDGVTWHYETVDDSPSVGQYASLAMDKDGYLHVSYLDLLNHNLKYAYQDVAGWHIETADNGADVAQSNTSLALDEYGKPHISYCRDYSHDLKYAYRDVYGWHIEIIDSIGNVGQHNSLALAENGYPHISYSEHSNNDLKYAYLDAGGWHSETIDIAGGQFTSIALDENSSPHISYHADSTLKYAHRDVHGWYSETVDSCGAVAGYYTSLALDRDSVPHISYGCHDGGSGTYYLKYTWWDTNTWQIETVDDAPEQVGLYSSLTLAGDNSPHISYLDDTNQDLKHAQKDDSGWHIEVVDGARQVGTYVSLALDENGYPHMSYEGNYSLKYTYLGIDGWHSEVVDSEGLTGRYTSFALDGNGYPHISYYDDTSDVLRYAYRDAIRWHIVTVDSDGDVGRYSSIALDSNNYPHISYYDKIEGNLKYAYQVASEWQIATLDSNGDVGQFTSLKLDENNYPHIGYYDVTNADLKYAYQDASGWHVETVDSEDNVGQDTTLVLDENDYPHIGYIANWPNSGLKYAYLNTFGWHTETVESGAIGCASLALDANNYPHISYYYNSNNRDLKYTYRDQKGWHNKTVHSGESVGQATSLVLDANGYPHIGYHDQLSLDLKYTYYSIKPKASPMTNVVIGGLITGIVDSKYSFIATVEPDLASLPITYLWQATGQSPVTHTMDSYNDTAAFTWSTTGTQTITVTAANSLGAVTATHHITILEAVPRIWLVMLYLDGEDFRLEWWLDRALRQIRTGSVPNGVTVVALIDGDGHPTNNDTRLYEIRGRQLIELTPNWLNSEMNVGDPDTLTDFVAWALETYPAEYAYLSLADHGAGVRGTIWDETDTDYLKPTSLITLTHNLTPSLDVVHLDACLMGMSELAYQFRDSADYLVASENLAFGIFAYADYIAALPNLTPAEFAVHIADTYYDVLPGYPRTISALDLGQMDALVTALRTLTATLTISDYSNELNSVLEAVQHFDSRPPYYVIDEADEYIDLYHFAQLAMQFVDDPAVDAAAQAVMDLLEKGQPGGVVLQEHHRSGTYGTYWNLDNSHGLSIYYPSVITSPHYAAYFSYPYPFLQDSTWRSFLEHYVGDPGPPLDPGPDPEPPQTPLPDHCLFMPIIIRDS